MIFLFFKTSRTAQGPILRLVQYVQVSFPGVTWSGLEAEHSHPSSAQVIKNEWNITFTVSACFHGVEMDSLILRGKLSAET